MKINLDPTDFFFDERYLIYKSRVIECCRMIRRSVILSAFYYIGIGAGMYGYSSTENAFYLLQTAISLCLFGSYLFTTLEMLSELSYYRPVLVSELKLFVRKKLRKRKKTSH